MTTELVVGYIAAFNIALLQLPRVWITYRTRNVEALSWEMLLLNLSASILWEVYGGILKKVPIIVANAIYFLANCVLLYMRYTFSKATRKESVHVAAHIDAPDSI